MATTPAESSGPLLGLFGPDLLPDRLEVVGGVKFGGKRSPGGLLNYQIDIPQAMAGPLQSDHLTNTHHDIPRDDLDSRGREFFPNPVLSSFSLISPRFMVW